MSEGGASTSDRSVLLARLSQVRPRVAADLQRPHAEEALLADLVSALFADGGVGALADVLGAGADVERVTLWGGDWATGDEDEQLQDALAGALPSAGRAVRLEAEPDLVVRTADAVLCLDATLGRPGHAAARAARGEPVPRPRLEEVSRALGTLGPDDVARVYPVARSAAVALALGRAVQRVPLVVALAARGGDLLRPQADALVTWQGMAGVVSSAVPEVSLRGLRWRELAARLDGRPGTQSARAVLVRHPLLA